MKNFPKTILCLGLILLSFGAMAQFAMPVHSGAKHVVSNGANKLAHRYMPHRLTRSLVAYTYYNLNYDSADARTNTATTHYDYQSELMNSHYVYPADTAGGNYSVVNNITVSFDSLYDPYFNTDTSYAGIAANSEVLVIDTIIFPIFQVNHSGTNDTLDISLNEVQTGATLGYPSTTVIKDTMIIGQQIGMSGGGYILWGLGMELSSNPRFSVKITYSGSKMDSCYFFYGLAGFNASCVFGNAVLANPTTWSPVQTSTGPVLENSFLLYNQFAAYGTLPDNTGADIYYDCDGSMTYNAGDGAAYEENIYIWALVHTAKDVTTGINNVASSGFSVGQNYPNPFNKETQISYSLTKSSDVTFSVYDMTGRVLVNNVYTNSSPGQHTINLSANSFSPGVYFYTFNVNGNKVTNKMVITE